ncbi:MAG: hypothetical protein NT096_00290 [Proteobacteria bacterium]|nr:hypothetical protein [Pseudomonadota bacterium]
MREKRTDVDFSKHRLFSFGPIGLSAEGVQENIVIHRLAVPETSCQSVKFINTCGILTVTGDYGNWIFCREFVPSADGSVSDQYWIEKLQNSSNQDPYVFDADKLKKEVANLKKNHELSAEEIEWLDSLAEAADDGEYSYIAEAMNYPAGFESEMIPKGKIVDWSLLVVFDTFDEICKRLKEAVK